MWYGAELYITKNIFSREDTMKGIKRNKFIMTKKLFIP